MLYVAGNRGSSFTKSSNGQGRIDPTIAKFLAEGGVPFHVTHRDCKCDEGIRECVIPEIKRRLGIKKDPVIRFQKPNLRSPQSAIVVSFETYDPDRIHASRMMIREIH